MATSGKITGIAYKNGVANSDYTFWADWVRNKKSDANNTSIILRIDYGSTSFLFVGDAEREAEQAVLNSNSDLSATVLKVGHHGSDTSSSYVFLREVMETP